MHRTFTAILATLALAIALGSGALPVVAHAEGTATSESVMTIKSGRGNNPRLAAILAEIEAGRR